MEEKLKTWQQPFFWLGWLNTLNPLFWITLAFGYYMIDEGKGGFFNLNTKRRISYWGIFAMIVLAYFMI